MYRDDAAILVHSSSTCVINDTVIVSLVEDVYFF